MTIESFIQAMPKVDLHVHLEGALEKSTLLMMADQNNIASSFKTPRQYQAWLAQIDEPDYKRLYEVANMLASWVVYMDDITRVVYDLGVYLHKQNVRYAEVSVNPAIYTDGGLPFDSFLEALNDGRDRVLRAWNVRMNWVMGIPRDRPRKADDIARWASNVAARRGNVVALGLIGREDEHTVSIFKKAFSTAYKKGLPAITHAKTTPDAEDSLAEVIDTLNPVRLTDCWGLTDDPEALATLTNLNLPVVVTPSREVRLGRIASVAEYPLQSLLDQHVTMLLGSGMPALYKSTLNEQYLAAATEMGLDVDLIEQMALEAVTHSFLPDEEKVLLFAELSDAYARLRKEHLADDLEADALTDGVNE